MSLPEWLTKEIFEDALRKYLHIKNINIVGMMSKHAVPAGDNYCSEMYRICVKYTTEKNGNVETISLIAKCKPENGMGQIITTQTPVFEKETEMYTTVLEKMQQLLGCKCFSADCLLAENGDHGWLILQDLAPLGYKMADRRAGLDKDHCLLVLSKIAKFHASSAMLYEQDPHSMDNFNRGIYTNQGDNKLFEQFCLSAHQSLLKAMDKWTGFDYYKNKLSKLMDKIFETSVKSAERRPGFNTLAHGDLWVNNMLFKYDSNNKPCDVKFVDFQFSVFANPSIDLQYFIHTSVNNEVGEKCVPQLLEYYYQELVKTLTKLNYPKSKVPTLESFLKDYNDRYLLGLTSAASVLPIAKAPSHEDANLDEIFKSNDDENGFRQMCYNTPEYKSRMQYLLAFFDKKGVFN